MPAGSGTVSTAAELARFVRMHLAGGTAHDGTRLLSAGRTRAMTQVQAARPPAVDAPLTQGLGWLMADWEGARVIGHGGGTIGQVSFLEAIPERDLIIVLLTNAESGGVLWRYLGRAAERAAAADAAAAGEPRVIRHRGGRGPDAGQLP